MKMQMDQSDMTNHTVKLTDQQVLHSSSRNLEIKARKLSFGYYKLNYFPYKKVGNSMLPQINSNNSLDTLTSSYTPI